MNPVLQAPLDQVIRQFRQNCLIQFDGALFRLDPQLLMQLDFYSRYEMGAVILFDADELPVTLTVEQCKRFHGIALETFHKAVATYRAQRVESEKQFMQLLEIDLLSDEEAE